MILEVRVHSTSSQDMNLMLTGMEKQANTESEAFKVTHYKLACFTSVCFGCCVGECVPRNGV